MPTSRPTLTATRRDVTGKHVSRLRAGGRLPAVVFGHGVASENVSLDTHEFEQLRRRVSPNSLVDLAIDDKKARPVLVYGVQTNRVTGRLLHADLFVVRMTEELTVDVPLVGVGESEAVKMHGGTLLHVTESLRVKALPDHLPQSVSYELTRLVDFESVIHVRDLEIPSDVTLLTDLDEIVAKVAPPRVEEAPIVVAAPAEGEAAAEGEAPGAAGGGEGSSEG